jgi:phospholipid transport system transporter-binding protein
VTSTGGAAPAVTLPARLTLPHACAALREVEAAVARGGELRLDASGVQDLDTSAVALLLQARRLARAAGLPYRLDAPPAKLTALARLYGVESLLSGSATGTSGAGPVPA